MVSTPGSRRSAAWLCARSSLKKPRSRSELHGPDGRDPRAPATEAFLRKPQLPLGDCCVCHPRRDPTATGDGGPGYGFPVELVPGLRHGSAGALQMANAGPDSNGSQYCLMLGAQQWLNYLHTVFDRVVRGFEVFPAIQQGDTIAGGDPAIGRQGQGFPGGRCGFWATDRQGAALRRPVEARTGLAVR